MGPYINSCRRVFAGRGQALLQQLQRDLEACNARLAAEGRGDGEGGRGAGRELLDEREYLEAELEFRGMEVRTCRKHATTHARKTMLSIASRVRIFHGPTQPRTHAKPYMSLDHDAEGLDAVIGCCKEML